MAARHPPADVRIGVSGWTYAPWRGAFYPEGLGAKRELAYAAQVFRSLEVNGTFYGLQKPEVFARWAAETPDDFLFAVKGPRFITHMKRLKEVEAPLANFFASGVLKLGRKLGPVLWQLPASFPFDEARLDAFLSLLPRNMATASELARRHDARLEGRAAVEAETDGPLRHALEIRHDSYRTHAFTDLLRHHGVALVCADTVEWPLLMDATADFIYVRLHGSQELYRSAYPPEELDRWAARVGRWREGQAMTDGAFIDARSVPKRPRDVFVYFDNTDKLHAPDDARALMTRLGQAPGRPDVPVRRGRKIGAAETHP
ncbi:DUF72 domain-containing protein [Azorhizobium caulinodans]|uniref:DUF72 domain-containing protein n=1 Tax=Azorhizobium caulinodans TaxID=7 RepID=UPI002FBE8680